MDVALRCKLDDIGLPLRDVLADTMQWIGWDKHFGPLSGHQGKLQEEDQRKILTVFVYGTGLGPTQIAKNVADASARQVSFVNQRQVTTEKFSEVAFMYLNFFDHYGTLPYQYPIIDYQPIIRIPIAGPEPFNTLAIVRGSTVITPYRVANGKLERRKYTIGTAFSLIGFDPRIPYFWQHSSTAALHMMQSWVKSHKGTKLPIGFLSID